MPDARKPSLAALMEQQRTKAKAKKAAPAPATAVVPAEAPPPPPPLAVPERPTEMLRAVFVRRFIAAYLKDGSAAGALRGLRPNVSKASSRPMAHELLECEDVQAELLRQLNGIRRHADLDEDYVKRHLRAMACSDITDFLDIDPATGKVLRWKLDPNQLTPEQRLNIRSLRIDAKTQTITHLGLVDRQAAVDSIARILKLYLVVDDAGLKTLVADITARMADASKRVPQIRTFDHETGEEID